MQKQTQDRKSPDVSVIIVTYNNEKCIASCLEHVFLSSDALDCEVIVVDNNSYDRTCCIVAENFCSVIVCKNKENVGFARAVNQGISLASSQNILLLNSDVIIGNDFFECVAKYYKELKNNCIFSPLVVNKDGTIQNSSFGRFPSLFVLAAEFLLPYKVSQYFGLKTMFPNENNMNNFAYEWLSGACLGFTKAVYDKIGGFDEDFFMYFEDIDFFKRASKYRILPKRIDTVKVLHGCGESFSYSRGKTDRDKYIRESLRVYLSKYESRLSRHFLAGLWHIGQGLRWFQKRFVSGNASKGDGQEVCYRSQPRCQGK